jgi:hypothetical protein
MTKVPPTPEIIKTKSPKFKFPKETSKMPPLTRIYPRKCLVDLSAQMAFNFNNLIFKLKDETLVYEGFKLVT